MSRMILLVIFLAISFPAAHSAQTDQSSSQIQVLQGEIENVDGSPVRIIEAAVLAVDDLTKPKPAKNIRVSVKVKNISGSRIRRLNLACSLESPAGGIVATAIAVDDLGPGETRVAEDAHLTMGGVRDMSDRTYLIRPTGAEFTQNFRSGGGSYFSGSASDGQPAPTQNIESVCPSGPGFENVPYWAAPRTEKHPFFRELISTQNRYIAISRWDWADGIFEGMLKVHSPEVVAYRLGVIKDIVSGFEVKVGRWTKIDPSLVGRRVYIPIKATDPDTSLTPDELFPRESYTRYSRSGKAITNSGGVAVFVAEVKLGNGKVWKQCKKRAALLWNNN